MKAKYRVTWAGLGQWRVWESGTGKVVSTHRTEKDARREQRSLDRQADKAAKNATYDAMRARTTATAKP